MPERLVSIKEAAELLGVSKSRLRAWDDNGKFSAVRTPGNCRRYRLSDIRRFQGLVEQEDGKTDAVAAYLRVSSHEQKQKGDLERQKGRVLRSTLKSMIDTLETGQVTYVNLTAVLARVRERLGTELLDHADVRIICDELEAARELLDVTCRHGLERDAAIAKLDRLQAERDEYIRQTRDALFTASQERTKALECFEAKVNAEAEQSRLRQLLDGWVASCRCGGWATDGCSTCRPTRVAMEAK